MPSPYPVARRVGRRGLTQRKLSLGIPGRFTPLVESTIMKYLNRIICSALMAVQIFGGLPIATPIVAVSQTPQRQRQLPTTSEPYQDKSQAGDPEEKIKSLIVMIEGRFGDEVSFGAGIIFGFQLDRIYIATANHVVRKGTQEAQNLQVKFKWLPGESIEARLLKHSDKDLDLAVLAVVGRRLGMDFKSLPFNELGDPSSLKRGDAVYMIGNPSGQQWRVNVTPDNVSSKSGNIISFETAFIRPGHAGGALLNKNWELVGMIKADEPPDGKAVNIKSVIDTLREWEYPVDLSPAPPRIPIGQKNVDPSPIPPTPSTLNLPFMSDESGWITKSGQVGTGSDHRPQAGDFNNNDIVRGFLSFDLTSIPRNATVQSARLILPESAQGTGDVFPKFGSLKFEAVWYGLSLIPQAYDSPGYLVLQNAYGQSSVIGVTAGVEKAIQQGYRRFQIRFSFSLGTDNDGSGEIYWVPDAPSLEVVYIVPNSQTSTPDAPTVTSTRERFLRVLYPNGGEVLERNKPYLIRWESHNIGDWVKIYLKGDPSGTGGLFPVVERTPNNGKYELRIPGNYGYNLFRVIIQSLDGTVRDESDSYFVSEIQR